MIRIRNPLILVLLIITFLFARNAGGGFPQLTYYLTLGVTIGALLWTWGMGRRLEAWIDAEGRQFQVGDSVDIKVRLENDGPAPMPWLRLTDHTGSPAEPPVYITTLGSFGHRLYIRTIRLVRRGRYPIGPVVVEYGDPMGIFRGRQVLEGTRHLKVYPAIHRLPSLMFRERQPFGRRASKLRAYQDPSSLADVRPLTPVDNPRFIHWKVSAKRGELHVKEFELRATTTMLIVVDMAAAGHSGHGVQGTEEFAASLAISLAAQAAFDTLPVGLILTSRRPVYIPAGHGDRQFRLLRDAVTTVHADGPLPLAERLDRDRAGLPAHASLLLITASFSRPLMRTLIRLRRAGHDINLFYLARETFDPDAHIETQRERLVTALEAAGITIYWLRKNTSLSNLQPGSPYRKTQRHQGSRAAPPGSRAELPL